jgi:CubicO group peptidase (beta-lactamase class C family)
VLPRVEALLRAETTDHLGAQLEVRFRHGAPISLAVGQAKAGAAMRADTLLPWFSCTKIATAVAVVQQWERGAVAHLDDAVATYLPDFAAHGKGAVTVRHLLTHTAGFPKAVSQADNRRLSWDETLERISAAPLEPGWVPGRRAAYHPVTAFQVLGEIVQRVSGRPFADYVAEEVFEPLDMADSWIALPPSRYEVYDGQGRIGLMHAAGPDRRVVRGLAEPDSFAKPLPSGSGIGPMADLVKLMEALRDGGVRHGERILQETTVEAMAARHRVGLLDETFAMVIDWGLGVMVNSWHYQGKPTRYGYGDHASPRTFGHGGSQSSIAFADPEAGMAVALCTNGMPGEGGNHRRTQPLITALYEDLGLAK